MAQPMQQQPNYVHDLKEVCEKASYPCLRDGTTVDIASRAFGTLRVSRCAQEGCGELFVYQYMTGHEMPLHVLGRQDEILAAICFDCYEIALKEEGRGNEPINLGAVSNPIITDL